VLGVEDRFPPAGGHQGDGLGDHGQVLVGPGLEHVAHVHVPALADECHHRGLAGQQGEHALVRFGRGVLAAGHAEGGQAGVFQAELPHVAEERLVLGVAQRVAALDVVHAQLVQPFGHQQLVFQAQRDPFALGAVAERRVVNPYAPVVVSHISLFPLSL
jgi:hypothetical protein